MNHTKESAINKTISKFMNKLVLTPLSYHEHLPNLEMIKIRVLVAKPFDACSQINVSSIFPIAD